MTDDEFEAIVERSLGRRGKWTVILALLCALGAFAFNQGYRLGSNLAGNAAPVAQKIPSLKG